MTQSNTGGRWNPVRGLLWGGGLLWGMGCPSAAGPPDAVRYADLIAEPPADPVAGLAACDDLRDPDLQGDCGLAMARLADPPESLCPQVQGEIWQAECYFMAAEDHNKAGDGARAAQLCMKSGDFTDHCAQHLWQKSLRGLTWNRGSSGFSETLPRAQRIYQEWSPLLASETDLEVRFWRRFYEGGFERDRLLNADAACAPLPTTEDQQRCRAAAATLYARRIQEVTHLPRAVAALCHAAPASSASLTASGVPQFRAVPSEDLDPVVARAQERYCGADGTPQPETRALLSPGP